jgi:hypothetical protein
MDSLKRNLLREIWLILTRESLLVFKELSSDHVCWQDTIIGFVMAGRVYKTKDLVTICLKRAARDIEARSCNHCCCGETVSISYSECVSVFLITTHAKHMLYRIFPVSHNWHFSQKRKTEQKMCFGFLLQLLSGTLIIISRIQRPTLTK